MSYRSTYLLAGAVATAIGLAVSPAQAGKSDDTLSWATDREVAVVDPYYNNTRELVVMGHLGWDGLLFRDLKTGEFKPLYIVRISLRSSFIS